MSEYGLPELPVLLHLGRQAAHKTIDLNHGVSSQSQSHPAVDTPSDLSTRERKRETGSKRRKLKSASSSPLSFVVNNKAKADSLNSDAQRHLESLSQVYRSAFHFETETSKFCNTALGESINSTVSINNGVSEKIPAEHGPPIRRELMEQQMKTCCDRAVEADSNEKVKLEPDPNFYQNPSSTSCDCDQCRQQCAFDCECNSDVQQLQADNFTCRLSSLSRLRMRDATPRSHEEEHLDSAFSVVRSEESSEQTNQRRLRLRTGVSREDVLSSCDDAPRKTVNERRSQVKQLQRQRNNLHAYLRTFLSDEQIEFMEGTAPMTKRRSVNRPSYGWSWDTLHRMTKLYTELGQHGYAFLKTVVGLPLPHTTELRRLRTGYQLGSIPDDSRPAASSLAADATSTAGSVDAVAMQPCLTAIRISGGLPADSGLTKRREYLPRARWSRRSAPVTDAPSRNRSPKWTRNNANTNRNVPGHQSAASGTSSPAASTTQAPLTPESSVGEAFAPASKGSKKSGVSPKTADVDAPSEDGLVGINLSKPRASKRRADGQVPQVHTQVTDTRSAKRSSATSQGAHASQDDELQLQPIRIDQLTLNVRQLFSVDD